MLQSKTRWKVQQADQQAVMELITQLKITPLVAQLLVNRGLDTVESARSFLFPDQEFHDPYLLKDMDKAVERIRKAIQNNENILIFGDYDADGVSSTTVLMETLAKLGANVDYYIPNRFSEGYGPNEQAFRQAKDRGIHLIITVDTGISALNEAIVARDLGMDYIVTDHHEPGPELPYALAVIHPKRHDSEYPFQELAGVGVAFKLAHALLGELPDDLLEIAAIGTIADLVPLQGENRLIASLGIERMRRTSRPGIRALFKQAGVELHTLTEESIGFSIAPRINAAGRLGDADPAVDLMMTRHLDEASSIAEEIDSLNKERQTIVSDISKEAIAQVEAFYTSEDNKVLIVGAEGWNAGVIGIVASKLVEKYYRPTIVLSYDKEKGLAKGSARSIAGFDLYGNLYKCRDILPHFGGHPMAAGMTLKLDDVADLRKRLNMLAAECMTPEDYIPITKVDAVIGLQEATIETIQEMEKLSPFGMGNPKPKVLIPDISASALRKIGADGSHLKASLKDGDFTLDAVGFGFGEYSEQVSQNAKISVIGELSVNEWNNIRKPQLFLQDLSVEHWQLFDIRGSKKLDQLLSSLPSEELKLIFFNQELADRMRAIKKGTVSVITDEASALAEDLHGRNVVLVDMPTDEAILKSLLQGKQLHRLYVHFHQQQQHYFSTVPNRDHFKWFYALLLKKGPLDLNRYGREIAKLKGWSYDTVDFICKVFFELEFVTIDNGIITVNKQAQKRDISEAPSYVSKQKQIKLENELLYSNYHQLYKKIESYVSDTERKLKEETTSWI